MPIYDYECQACHHRFEAMQKMSEDKLKECPQCKELALKKLVSAPAFQLKGGGWYVTDFKNSNAPKPAANGTTNKESGDKDSKESRDASASGSTSTTEATPAAATETKTSESKTTESPKPSASSSSGE